MSDIVERLRSAEPCGIDRCREMSVRGGCLCEIAAAEIERLRAVLQSIAANTCCETCQEAALVARTALARAPQQGGDMSDDQITQAELRATFPNGEIPMWAVDILFNSPDDWTVEQVRKAIDDRLRRAGEMSRDKIIEVMARALCEKLTAVFMAAEKGETNIKWEDLAAATLSAQEAAGFAVVPELFNAEAADRAWQTLRYGPRCFDTFVCAINQYVAAAKEQP